MICVAVLGLLDIQPTWAASPGCEELDSRATVVADDWVAVLQSPLQPGDRVSITLTSASGSPSVGHLEVPVHNEVDTGALPVTLSHVIQPNGLTGTTVRVWITGGAAVIDWACESQSSGGGSSEFGGNGGSGGFAQPPDDRINFRQCDTIAAVYRETAADGSEELHVYGVSSAGSGAFLLKIAPSDIEPYLNQPPSGNQLIKANGTASFYALAAGGFLLRLGPDTEGKLCDLDSGDLHFANANASASTASTTGQQVTISSSICLRGCRAGRQPE